MFRDGKQRTVDVQTALRPTETQLAQNGGSAGGDEDQNAAPGASKAAPNLPVLGMYLTPVDPAARDQFNIPSSVRGVLVAGVQSSSDASDKGLRRGDVVVRAGDRDVTNVGDIAAAIADWKKAGRTIIPLSINHAGRSVVVPLKIAG